MKPGGPRTPGPYRWAEPCLVPILEATDGSTDSACSQVLSAELLRLESSCPARPWTARGIGRDQESLATDTPVSTDPTVAGDPMPGPRRRTRGHYQATAGATDRGPRRSRSSEVARGQGLRGSSSRWGRADRTDRHRRA